MYDRTIMEPILRHRYPGLEQPAFTQAPDFMTETWFVALLMSMVAVMCLLFAALLFVRRRQLDSKKSGLPGNSAEQVIDLRCCEPEG